MPDLRTLKTMKGVVDMANNFMLAKKAVQMDNLQIEQTKQKLTQDKEAFDTQKKINELKLKQMEADPRFSPAAIATQKKIQDYNNKIMSSMIDKMGLELEAKQQVNKTALDRMEAHGQGAQAGYNVAATIIPSFMTEQYPELKFAREAQLGDLKQRASSRVSEAFKSGRPEQAIELANRYMQRAPETEDVLYQTILSQVDPTKAEPAQIGQIKQMFPNKTKEIEDYFDVTGADIRGKTMAIKEERMMQKQALQEVQDLGLTNATEEQISQLSPNAQSYIRENAKTTTKDGEVSYNLGALTTFKAKEKAKKEIKRKFEAQEKIDTVNVIKSDVNSLFEIYDNIPKNLLGPIQGRISGSFEKLAQNVPEVAAYEELKQTILSNVARQIGGEKGVLTDKDVDRIAGFFPKLTDKDSVAKKKLSFVQDFISRRIDEYQGRITKDVEFEQAIKDIQMASDEEEKVVTFDDGTTVEFLD